MENLTLREHIFSLVAIELKNQMKMLTSDKHSSNLQMKTKDLLKRFTWERVWLEIETHCPALSTITYHFGKQCASSIAIQTRLSVKAQLSSTSLHCLLFSNDSGLIKINWLVPSLMPRILSIHN